MLGRKINFGLKLTNSETFLVLTALEAYVNPGLDEDKKKLMKRFQKILDRYDNLDNLQSSTPLKS